MGECFECKRRGRIMVQRIWPVCLSPPLSLGVLRSCIYLNLVMCRQVSTAMLSGSVMLAVPFDFLCSLSRLTAKQLWTLFLSFDSHRPGLPRPPFLTWGKVTPRAGLLLSSLAFLPPTSSSCQTCSHRWNGCVPLKIYISKC